MRCVVVRCVALAFALICAGNLCNAWAAAQTASQQTITPQPPTLKPYTAINVELSPAPKDPSFQAFRKQLATIARKQDRAALQKLVTTGEFFWDNDLGGMYDAKKSNFENLLRALRLDEAHTRGWLDLSAMALEPTVGPLHDRRNVVCAPAQPGYADAELVPLMEETNSDVVDWYYPRKSGAPVRSAPQITAAVIEMLDLALVRVIGLDRRKDDIGSTRSAWARVATPGGRSGFVAPDVLLSPLTTRLCFAKSGRGWTITGFVGD